MNPHELKHMHTRLAELEAERIHTKARWDECQKRIEEIDKATRELKKKIAKATANRKPLVVTEHAMLRYIERVMKVNLDEIRSKVVGGALLGSFVNVMDGTFPVGTHSVRIKDGHVVTVLV